MSSRSTLKIIAFDVTSENYGELLSHDHLTRSIVSLNFLSGHNLNTSVIKEITASFGSQIIQLKLQKTIFTNFEEFSLMLLDLKVLEVLELDEVRFTRVIVGSRTRSLPVAQLKELSVSGNCSQFYRRFFRLLKNAQKLTTLKLCALACDRIFQTAPRNKLALKRLDIEVYHIFDNALRVEENLALFFISQRNSLIELRLSTWHKWIISERVLAAVFNSLENLETFHFDASELGIVPRSFQGLPKLKNLKQLTFKGNYNNDTLILFFELSPNIESLILDQKNSEILNWISNENLKIRELLIESFNSTNCSKLILNSLQKISVNKVENIKNWLTFVCNNPTIEALEINSANKLFTKSAIKTLIEQPNLKHIIIKGNLERMSEIYEKMKINYGKLKSMRLIVDEGHEVLGDFLFNFPINGETWSPKCVLLDKASERSR